MLDQPPVEPHGGAVFATGVRSDLALNQPLPLIFQFDVNPASHIESDSKPNPLQNLSLFVNFQRSALPNVCA